MACTNCDFDGYACDGATCACECHEKQRATVARDAARWRAVDAAVDEYAKAREVFRQSVWGDAGDGPYRRMMQSALDLANAALKAKGGE